MINIVFVHSVAKIGGAERVSQMLMLGLSKRDFNVVLMCGEDGEFIEWAKQHQIAHFVIDLSQPSVRNPILTLQKSMSHRQLFLRENIDVVHTADPYAHRATVLGAYFARCKRLCHFHFPFEREHLHWLFKRLPAPTSCVFVSQDLERELSATMREVSSQIVLETIHNGVDSKRFVPSKAASSSSLHIGIVANLQKRKGHDEFIEMAAQLNGTYQNLHFDIIGGDILQEPREALLATKAKALGLSNITFHGQVSDVLALLAALDIVVCASHQEAFPIAILEAMAMQKAIVSTNVNGIPEAIVDEQSGLLVEPFAPQALADKVARLIEDPELRHKLALEARHRVTTLFDITHFIETFSSHYQGLMKS